MFPWVKKIWTYLLKGTPVSPKLPCHINFIVILLLSTKYFTRILIGVILNIYIKLERIDILILNFSIFEHEILFHLFISLLYSFLNQFFDIVFIIFFSVSLSISLSFLEIDLKSYLQNTSWKVLFGDKCVRKKIRQNWRQILMHNCKWNLIQSLRCPELRWFFRAVQT